MDRWDVDVELDALSLQEVVGGGSMGEPNEVRTMRTRRGHVVPGTFRVAVVAHRGWAPDIASSPFAPGGRSISMVLSWGRRSLQVLSSHLPSTLACDFNTDGLHTAEFFDMFKGRRRHWTMAGVDANVRLVTPEPGVCGRALQRADGHAGASEERKAAELVITEAVGYDMKVTNTFEEWWLLSKMDAPLPKSRSTWSGQIYGTLTQRSLDHLLVDTRTSSCWSRSACRRMSCPSNHMAPMHAFDFAERLPEVNHRRPQGPTKKVGWWPHNTDTDDGAVAAQLARRV